MSLPITSKLSYPSISILKITSQQISIIPRSVSCLEATTARDTILCIIEVDDQVSENPTRSINLARTIIPSISCVAAKDTETATASTQLNALTWLAQGKKRTDSGSMALINISPFVSGLLGTYILYSKSKCLAGSVDMSLYLTVIDRRASLTISVY